MLKVKDIDASEKLLNILGNEKIDPYSEIKTDQTPLLEDLTNEQEIDGMVRVTKTGP